MRVRRRVLRDLTAVERQRLLSRGHAAQGDAIEPLVREIVDAVREEGDRAVLRYTRRFDGVELSAATLRVGEEEFEAAESRVAPGLRQALTEAVANIRAHHQAQLPAPSWMKEVSPGVLSGERVTPLDSVGLYVPRGKGSFPSVMAMLCVPAQLAQVPRVQVCTPAGPDGQVDPASLVVARMCGVTTVFRVGGAQAIAALAHGTETIPGVDKIVGPGSPYVATAKRLVYGVVDPGPPAGPSESIVLCDELADPDVAVRELLVEAEHGPDSAALLITHSDGLAGAVAQRVPGLVERLGPPRSEFCTAVLEGAGGIVLTAGLEESVDFANAYAPEHLRLLVRDPFSLLPRIRNAGEVLLGEHTSIAFGNYAIGLNAILPTGGMARSGSCVGVHEFLKRSSFAYVAAEGVPGLGAIATELARHEGFPAHADAAAHAAGRVRRL